MIGAGLVRNFVGQVNEVKAAILAQFAASNGSSLVGFISSGAGAVARTAQAKHRDTVGVGDYGAVGDGVADDTAAINSALAAHKLVHLQEGKTYLVGEITAALDGQVLIAHGATLKLKDAQASGFMLTLSGQRAKVLGGTWDGNKANQAGATFNYANIRVTGSHCEVAHTHHLGSRGIGIMAPGGDYNHIHHNTVADCRGYGIYVEKVAADGAGNRVTDNVVTNTADAGAYGIYLTGQNAPFTFKQRNWIVRGNVAIGPSAAPTGVGITVRGVDGICSDNSTEGFSIGLSCDITSDSVISGNRCYSAAGGVGYCIEVNGEGNSIVGNKTRGGINSLAMSVADPAVSLSDNVITGNQFEAPSSRAIYIQATAGGTANRLNISGNTIKRSAGNGAGIYLAGACQYSRIGGNQIVGPGSGVAGSRAVFLDAVNSNVAIVGNTIAGWERAVTCYNTSATEYTDIQFHDNDCRQDVAGTPSLFLNVEGTATIGGRCSALWNKQNTAGDNQKHFYDLKNNRYMEWSNSFGTPEGNVAAGVGSLYININGGAGTTLFVKQANTTNVGWAGK